MRAVLLAKRWDSHPLTPLKPIHIFLTKTVNPPNGMTNQQSDPAQERTRTVVLVNALDNPVAQIDDSTFQGKWRWLKTARDWKPGDPLPDHEGTIDALIVFSARYHDEGIRQLCEAVRARPELASIPLLVAIDQYQMPLANRVRQMPYTDFVVTPIEEKSLLANLDRATASRP